MPVQPAMPDALNPSSATVRLKVFISYARVDGSFAQELLAGLELAGFDAYLDKEDIAPGEPWQDRLGNLIRLADTIVFVITPSSVRSTYVDWEVQESIKASKRLVPVLAQPVPDADVPERLRRLNYVVFADGQSFTKGLLALAEALRSNAPWIREHNRYGELARRWDERQRTAALLLRGTDLEDATNWMKARPHDAPEISAIQLAFVDESTQAAREELVARVRLRRRSQVGLGLAALVLAALMVLFAVQWQRARTANVALDAARGELDTQNRQLAATNARLQRKLALRTAPFGNQPFDVPAGWFQVATGYAGAVAFVERADRPGQTTASGAIVNAAQLDARWAGPALVTGIFVIADDEGPSNPMRPEAATIVAYGPDGQRHAARLGKVLWQSKKLGISISSIEDALPVGSDIIDRVTSQPAALEKSPILTEPEIDSLFDAAGMLKAAGPMRPIVFVGNREGRKEVTLSISHLLGTTMTGGSRAEIEVDLIYTYVTAPGSSGSPIFDAETGDLIGIHLNGHPCPGVPISARRCYGSGTSMRRIVTAIRGEADRP